MSNTNHSSVMTYRDFVAGNVRAQAGRQLISQAELCRRTGMSAGTLSRKWLGRYPFDVDELESIARALDVPLSSLISNTGPDGGGTVSSRVDRPVLLAA